MGILARQDLGETTCVAVGHRVHVKAPRSALASISSDELAPGIVTTRKLLRVHVHQPLWAVGLIPLDPLTCGRRWTIELPAIQHAAVDIQFIYRLRHRCVRR